MRRCSDDAAEGAGSAYRDRLEEKRGACRARSLIQVIDAGAGVVCSICGGARGRYCARRVAEQLGTQRLIAHLDYR